MVKMYLSLDIKLSILLIFNIIRWVVGYEMSEDKIQVGEFDVIPGGQPHTHEKEWNGFVCRFSYVCQGGTKEQWLMGLSLNQDQTKYLCSVERPGGVSYLFFQSFKLEVSGVEAKEAEALASKDKPLKEKEFKLDFEQNSISDVPGKFESHLEKVAIYAEKGKAEL